MLIQRRRGWEIAESRVTPEAVVLGRRAALGMVAGAGAVAAARPARAWSLFGGGSKAPPVDLKPLTAPRRKLLDRMVRSGGQAIAK